MSESCSDSPTISSEIIKTTIKLTWRHYLYYPYGFTLFVSLCHKYQNTLLVPHSSLVIARQRLLGQWFCHPGVLWPLEDEWSISLWEVWCSAADQRNTVLKWIVLQVAINSAASGLGTAQNSRVCHHWGDSRWFQAGVFILMCPSHDISLKYLQCSVPCCAALSKAIVFSLTWNKLQSSCLIILPLAGLESSFSNRFFPFHSAPVKSPLWNRRSEQTGAEENKSWPQTFDLNLT